ncbi:putative 2-aminoethylphosphonate ABC transporter permease subunit [Clostridium sp. AF19-22AC]|jgi:iron(III) transport system permease protein|uniref:putative 2-aminoethylphosphonate ABC transporter permease subunit n=1 Tax=Clostridia TaxID=186801 RepID=UPI000E506E75|nr:MULTISPECIES: putative 2-aminoethylphosphonate ABC transporter permease subunit [Clostridia]RHR28067.1 putative 2-aminoethylphosphonate ABC transporter permease subunit [Clostridium sp. AF19-22AC]
MERIKAKIRGGTKEDIVRGILICCVVLFLVLFLVFPLCTLFMKAFQNKDGAFVGLDQFIKYFQSKSMVYSISHTFFIAIVSTIISVTMAFFFSYALSRKNVPWKGFFRYIGMIPIFAPTMLLGIALIYLFGNKGILTGLGLQIPLYGKVGIIIAESIYCFPVATTILMVAFSAADNRLYEAADTMGTSAIRKMFTITIPNVKYGLISAIFVAFTYSFTDFGAPSVVGGNYNVLATDVYKQVVGQQNFNMGAVVGIILLFPAVLSFAVDRITSQKQSAAISAKSVPYQIKPHRTSDTAATLFCLLVTVAMMLFFAVALFASVIKLWPYNLTFTLSNYDLSKVSSGNGFTAFKNSILISLISAFLGTCITFIGAYVIEKNQKFKTGRRAAYLLSITPLAIPGTVVGLSFIMFFNAPYFQIPFLDGYMLQNPFHGIYGTIWIIVLANMIHFYSVPFSTATTALKGLDKEFETVSESLAVPFYKTLGRVTLPLCMPAICEMWVYFFVNSLVTVSAVVFLFSPAAPIASVVIVSMEGAGQTAPAAAMCMLLLFINLIVRLLYENLKKYRGRK